MNKRKLATLVAASFAALMLSSPSFATDANKAQTTTSGSDTPESRSSERTDKQGAESDASRSNMPRESGASESRSSEREDKQGAVSKKAEATAKADYKAAVEKCDSQPVTERGTCVQDAKDAQSLAMNKARKGSRGTSGAPASRIGGPQSSK